MNRTIKRAFEKLNELEGASPEHEDRKKIEKKDAKATRREPGQRTLFRIARTPYVVGAKPLNQKL